MSINKLNAEKLADVVDEYLHWRKVNPHIKGGENYLKRLRSAAKADIDKAISGQPVEGTYPHLLCGEEKQTLLQKAEDLWCALEENKLGGLSGINRPFLILHEFKEVIEQYGGRDVGLTWSANDLRNAKPAKQEDPQPVCWTYCPECGNQEYQRAYGGSPGERVCLGCGQSWFPDVDYINAVRANLAERHVQQCAPKREYRHQSDWQLTNGVPCKMTPYPGYRFREENGVIHHEPIPADEQGRRGSVTDSKVGPER